MLQQSELPHHPDQLVVDLQQLPLVKRYLEDAGIVYDCLPGDDRGSDDPVDEDENLGLARLRNVRQLREPTDLTVVPVPADLRELRNLDDGQFQAVDLDSVLSMLRQRIAADRDGWVPVLGKNRWIDSSFTAGTKPMGIEDPTVPDAAEIAELLRPDPDADPLGGQGVRVGIVDTPLHNQDDESARLDGVSFSAQVGHATFVRSLILQQAPNATVNVNPALDGVRGRADSWDTARAMLQVAGNGQVDLLNLSLGCYAPGGPPLVLSRAIERLSPGVLVVAAAGNHGALRTWMRNRDFRAAAWPAAQHPTLAVGALDQDDRRAAFSPDLPWVNCYARGVDVIAAYLDGKVELRAGLTTFSGFAKWSGTSFSAAIVTGAVATRLARERAAGRPQLQARTAFEELLLDDGQNVVRKFALAP